VIRLSIVGFVFAAACGGKPAETAPATPGVSLTAMDPDLSPLAKAAARSLEPASDGKVRFGGVFVGGRELRALSDTVARVIGATRVDMSDGRVPYTIGRAGSAENMALRRDATYALSSFRIAGDTAYVGVDARSAAEMDGAICVVLARAGATWLVNKKSVVGNPRSCGPTR
jgi:hypothetical protein